MTDGTCQYLKGEWCTMDPKYIKPDADLKENYCNTSKYEACLVDAATKLLSKKVIPQYVI